MSLRGIPRRVLVDPCVVLHYLLGDKLADEAESFIRSVVEGGVKAFFISEAYDDVFTGLRSRGVGTDIIVEVLDKWASIPHEVLPVTAEIAVDAIIIYGLHGGSRRLHYFDAFHVAGARHYNLPLITSDKYILRHSLELGIRAIDLRDL